MSGASRKVVKSTLPLWLQRRLDDRKRARHRTRDREKVSKAINVRESRAALLAELGNACACCGGTKSLIFYRPHGGRPMLRTVNQGTRVRQYWRDFRDGNLELLCRKCLDILLRGLPSESVSG
jgi:hypothetical protein